MQPVKEPFKSPFNVSLQLIKITKNEKKAVCLISLTSFYKNR